MRLVNLAGKRFGRLTALRVATGEEARSYVRWLCRCDCGVEKFIARTSLRSGDSQSCGCLQVEGIKARRTDHGKSKTPEYRVWRNMMNRCYDKSNEAYHNYGGRGIEVADRWHDFENFLADMGARPSAALTLDRVRNDLGYSKDNCRWATRSEQSNNTRRTVLITFEGETKSIAQWAETKNLNYTTLNRRLKVWGVVPEAFNSEPYPGVTPQTVTRKNRQ